MRRKSTNKYAKKAGAIFSSGCPVGVRPDKSQNLSSLMERPSGASAVPTHRPTTAKDLCAAPRSHCQIPHLGQNAGHLQAIQLREEGQYVGDELIFHQLADFFLTASFSAR